MTIKIDRKKTLAQLKHSKYGYKRFSWSKLNSYNSCPGNYLANNYLKSDELDSFSQENTLSIPGSLTQKIVEVLINERMYRKFKTLTQLYQWTDYNTESLFNLSVMAYEDQFEMKNARYFFKSDEGKARIQQVLNDRPETDPKVLVGAAPIFLNSDTFMNKYRSKENFLRQICANYPKVLMDWHESGLKFDKMYSEFFLSAKLGDVTLAGGIDFVYHSSHNENNGVFEKIEEIEDEYILFDGKYNISRYVKKEQLFFYAALIFLNYRKMPKVVGLYNWSKAKMQMYSFSATYIQELQEKIDKIVVHIEKVIDFLEKSEDDFIEWSEISHLGLTPDRSNCLFCNLNQKCKVCVQGGFNDRGFLNNILANRKTKQEIDELRLDKKKRINEMTLD